MGLLVYETELNIDKTKTNLIEAYDKALKELDLDDDGKQAMRAFFDAAKALLELYEELERRQP